MKKIWNFIKNFIIFAYILLIIFVTICLLSYNDYKLAVLGNDTLVPVIDEDLEPDYTVGDLLIINRGKLSKVEPGDIIFFYRKAGGEATINYAKTTAVERVTDTEYTFTVEGDYRFSSSYFIGEATSTTILPGVGRILGTLLSKWGFLFLGVFPSLVAFLYTLHSVVTELSDDEDEEEVKTKKKKKKKGTKKKKVAESEKNVENTPSNTKKNETDVENVESNNKENEEKVEEKEEIVEKVVLPQDENVISKNTEDNKVENEEDNKIEVEKITEEKEDVTETKEEKQVEDDSKEQEEKKVEISENKTEELTPEQKRKAMIEAKMKSLTEEEKKAIIKAKLDSMSDEEKKALIEAKKKKMEAEKNKKTGE